MAGATMCHGSAPNPADTLPVATLCHVFLQGLLRSPSAHHPHPHLPRARRGGTTLAPCHAQPPTSRATGAHTCVPRCAREQRRLRARTRPLAPALFSHAMPFPSKTLYSALFSSLVFTPRSRCPGAQVTKGDFAAQRGGGHISALRRLAFPNRWAAARDGGRGCGIRHITAPARQPWDRAASSLVAAGRGGQAAAALQHTVMGGSLGTASRSPALAVLPAAPRACAMWGAPGKGGLSREGGTHLALLPPASTQMSPG